VRTILTALSIIVVFGLIGALLGLILAASFR
jgi:hypothetical protein